MPTIKVLLTGTGGRPGRDILAAFEKYQKTHSAPYNISFEITILKRTEASNSESREDDKPTHPTIYTSDFANTTDLSAQLSKASPDIIVSALNAEPAPTLDKHLLDAILQHLSCHTSSTDHASISTPTPTRPRPLLFINGYTLDLLHPDVKRILNATQHATLEPKIAFAQRLATIAKDPNSSSFAYATIVTASFLDYCLLHGHLGIDVAKRTATLHDDGTKVLTGCSLRFVGDAVVAVALRHLSAIASTSTDPHIEDLAASVRNKRIRVAETFFSGRDLLDVVEECLSTATGTGTGIVKDRSKGEGDKFMVNSDSSADLLRQGRVIAYLNWSEFSRASTFTDDGLEFDEDGYLQFRRRTLRAICKEVLSEGLDGEKDFTMGL